MDNDIRTMGEIQLTDALQYLMDKGVEWGFSVSNWFDCSEKEVLLETNAMLLNQPEIEVRCPVCRNSKIQFLSSGEHQQNLSVG